MANYRKRDSEVRGKHFDETEKAVRGSKAVRKDVLEQNGLIRKEIKKRQSMKYKIKGYTEQTFRKAIEDYFDFIEENSIMPVKEHLAKWLGYTASTMQKFARGLNCERWKTEAILEAYDEMKAINNTMVYNKDKPIGAIFMGKAEYGMVETQKVELSPSSEMTVEDIDNQINELLGK